MAIERVNPGGSLWKERARFLQLQIRNRFRVAVDRRHRWTEESDYSSTFQRWILRARTLLGDSPSSQAPNSLMFYRKRVDKAVSAIDDSTIIRFLQALAVPVIGNACHMFMHGLNNIQIYGAEKLHQALLQRPQGKPLITVSNHVAAVDDPLVIASLLPPSVISDARNLRWTLCATDRCFSNPVLSAFFRCVKVLPVSRGDGIYQKGMDMALSKLNNGGWVHIFPEGSRSRDGGRTMGSPKRGVGRLVMDADSIPVVVPFVHSGMQEVMPLGTKLPKTGKKVTVLVGDPIYLDDLVVGKEDAQDVSRGILYDAVSSRIGHRLRELKVQVDSLVALELPPEAQSHNTESGYGIWQHVDWEAFGIENLMLGEEDFESQPAAKQVGDGAEPTVSQLQRPDSRDPTIGMSSLFQGGIVSRIRGHMNPTELMGFAARGLFMNDRVSDWSRLNFEEGSALKIWKQFFGETVFHQWSRI